MAQTQRVARKISGTNNHLTKITRYIFLAQIGCTTTQYLCTIKQEKRGEIIYFNDFENGYYDDDYISPVEAFEGDEELYNEWLLNS